MKYNKVNFLYREPTSIYSSYIYFEGFKKTLKKHNFLYYSFGVGGKESLDIKKLLKYPIICINGSWEPIFSIIKKVDKRQFVAEINTELLSRGEYYKKKKSVPFLKISRIKKYFSILKSSPRQRYREFLQEISIFLKTRILKDYEYPYKLMEKRSKYFDLYFSGSKEDLGKYFKKNCYFFVSWAHTEILDNFNKLTSNKILFVGALHDTRLNFLKEDKNKIVEIKNTIFKDSPEENVKELSALINNYKYVLCPIGIIDQYVPGKIFEYLACKKLCFCHSPRKNMAVFEKLFRDKKEIVYFSNFKELEEKYRYYRKNPKEAEKIALAGYNKVREYHNADVRIKRFVNIVLHHANGGDYKESYNDIYLSKENNFQDEKI